MNRPFKRQPHTDRYTVDRPISADEIVAMALRVVNRRYARGRVVSDPNSAREFVALRLGQCEHEVFCTLFLDTRHRLLAFEELFRGSIDGASVYPREVVKRAMALNAAAVIFAHNHPSGVAEPSRSDETITRRLIDALKLVEVRVLDHLIVGGAEVVSLAERGLI